MSSLGINQESEPITTLELSTSPQLSNEPQRGASLQFSLWGRENAINASRGHGRSICIVSGIYAVVL